MKTNQETVIQKAALQGHLNRALHPYNEIENDFKKAMKKASFFVGVALFIGTAVTGAKIWSLHQQAAEKHVPFNEFTLTAEQKSLIQSAPYAPMKTLANQVKEQPVQQRVA